MPNSPEPSCVEHARATVNGISLHFVEAGPRGARSIILLHGFPQSWLMWRFILPRLAREYRVVAVDLRGYGDSEKPPGEKGYDKGTKAADIRALVSHLELNRPLLIGHDRGARVARRYALDFPDALVGAAMLDILPEEWVYDNMTAAEAAERYWHWVFQVVPDVPEKLIAGHEETYLATLFARSAGVLDRLRADRSWEEYRRTFLQPGAVQAALSDYRATYHVDLPRYREERQAGRRIEVPVLLLWGSRGNLAGRPVLEVWRQFAEEITAAEISDCGHYLAEEQPEKVAEHLVRFAAACLP